MTKNIYISILNDYVNERLANFVINKQTLTWDKIDLVKYKSMYSTSKAWILFELWQSHLPQ